MLTLIQSEIQSAQNSYGLFYIFFRTIFHLTCADSLTGEKGLVSILSHNERDSSLEVVCKRKSCGVALRAVEGGR